tara:strand:- start:318 stop:617 length:300 start_codon:yes stop_codon:yes gene_type:complete
MLIIHAVGQWPFDESGAICVIIRCRPTYQWTMRQTKKRTPNCAPQRPVSSIGRIKTIFTIKPRASHKKPPVQLCLDMGITQSPTQLHIDLTCPVTHFAQ